MGTHSRIWVLPFAGSLILLGGSLPAQPALSAALQEIRRATEARDHPRAVRLSDSLARVFPDYPTVVLIRAIALARSGRRAEALDGVRRLFRWDPRFARRALEDSALAPWRDELADLEIPARAALADRPVARARVWATLEERDLIPEGTAWDPSTSSVLLGSLNKYKVVAVDSRGRVSDRVPAGRAGLKSVVGIQVDSTRRILWVTSNPRFDRSEDSTSAALFAFEARTGNFIARYPVPGAGRHFLNDLTTDRNGTVYVTDTQGNQVWVRRLGASRLDPLASVPSPNGITISDDSRYLFVASTDHIRVIPLEGGTSWKLAVPDSINLAGIDGLAFMRGTLIAHHPLAYWRIVAYPLDPARRVVLGRTVIESMTPDSRTSTTGEVVGDEYGFIGNSQIDRMNARTIDSASMQPIRLYRTPLQLSEPGLVAVALSGRDSVALFDPFRLERIGTLPVGKAPHEIAVSPDGRHGYVANTGTPTISVLDWSGPGTVAATWQLADSVRVHDLAVSPDGRRVWAVSGERNFLVEIDAATGRTTGRRPLTRTGGWMVEPRGPGNTLVIAHLEGSAVTLLSPVTGAQRVLERREGEIDAAATPPPDGREIWSVNNRDDSLTVHDLGRGTQQRLWSGRRPTRVMLTPDGRRALTVNGGDSTIRVFDVATRRRVDSLVVPAGPKVIALSRDGRRGYLTHPERGLLTLFDVAAMTVLTTVAVPGAPDGVAVAERRLTERSPR